MVVANFHILFGFRNGSIVIRKAHCANLKTKYTMQTFRRNNWYKSNILAYYKEMEKQAIMADNEISTNSLDKCTE